MARRTRAQLQNDVRVITQLHDDKAAKIGELQEAIKVCEIARVEADAWHDVERDRWRRREEDLIRDIESSKSVLRTLTIHAWGDKTDANLQYAVYGDGGGGVAEKTR